MFTYLEDYRYYITLQTHVISSDNTLIKYPIKKIEIKKTLSVCSSEMGVVVFVVAVGAMMALWSFIHLHAGNCQMSEHYYKWMFCIFTKSDWSHVFIMGRGPRSRRARNHKCTVTKGGCTKLSTWIMGMAPFHSLVRIC